MGRLVIATPGLVSSAFDLRPGRNLIGRGPKNNFRLDHDSISTAHCEIVFANGFTCVHDLASTNGTFIDGQRVEQEYLSPGQTLRLGDVELRYEATVPLSRNPIASTLAIVAKPDDPAPTEPPPLRPCCKHPREHAKSICRNCHQAFCGECMIRHTVEGKVKTYCPFCNGTCVPVAQFDEEQRVLKEKKAVSRSFSANLKEAYRYPLKREGPYLLAGGAVLYGVIDLVLRWAASVGPFGLGAIALFTVFGAGYLFSYMWHIVASSAQGEEVLPDWPDFSDWYQDIAIPFLHYVALQIVCFGPAFFYLVFHGYSLVELFEEPGMDVALYFLKCAALALAGAIYFPMATLAVVVYDNILALNPITVIQGILRVPKEYFVACVSMWAVVICAYLSNLLMEIMFQVAFKPLPGVAAVVLNFLALYFLAVSMRIVGVIYYCTDDKLAWFKPMRRE